MQRKIKHEYRKKIKVLLTLLCYQDDTKIYY